QPSGWAPPPEAGRIQRRSRKRPLQCCRLLSSTIFTSTRRAGTVTRVVRAVLAERENHYLRGVSRVHRRSGFLSSLYTGAEAGPGCVRQVGTAVGSAKRVLDVRVYLRGTRHRHAAGPAPEARSEAIRARYAVRRPRRHADGNPRPRAPD